MWRKETNRKWRWRMRTSKKQKNEKDDRENKFYLRYIMFNCWCIKQSLIVQDDLNSFFHVIFHLFENRLCQKRLVEEEEKEKETISNRFYVVFKIFVRKISNSFFYTHILLPHSSLPFLGHPFHLSMKYWNALSGKKVSIGGYPAVTPSVPTDKRATTNGRRFQISLLIF